MNQAKVPVGVYIDGFNLYHSILYYNEPHLKWLNLRKLSELFIDNASEHLERIVFCTAFYPGDSQKRFRHEEYLRALRVVDVVPIIGHYIHEDMDCRKCDHIWQKPTEKESDVNLALNLFNDAHLGRIERAYLLTRDSDQAATARMFREFFPKKKFITVSPPGRAVSQHILRYAHDHIALTKEHAEKSLFPPIVFREGMAAGRRPREYAPPAGWTPPG